MDASERKKNRISKETNNNDMHMLDEFLGMDGEVLLPKNSLSFSEDLHQILEERKMRKQGMHPSAHSYMGTMSAHEMERREPVHIDAWSTKKKRRNSSMFWNYMHIDQRGMHPDKESVYADDPPHFIKKPMDNRAQKLFLGVIKKPSITYEKSTINSILPLYLNATTSFEGAEQKKEFLSISQNFIEKVEGVNYESLTVQQLKSIMKEFGLNYTGKKQELINRIQQTYQKILRKKEKEGMLEEDTEHRNQKIEIYKKLGEEMPTESDKSSYGFMFF
ncbi:hypothetical protein NEFER03_0530 [Nematocida sp. LUAm3]|nr:hypothetical protein NEFER03_0530 [Nematocida sp. LUAm3]KAI5175497.1 hypothetical protein NEFER02_1403 [Nematocida sp. LUAm2]KAI5178473.1 hypothetical protein NEFER01_1620 [Nematocida sp. LUAm1]